MVVLCRLMTLYNFVNLHHPELVEPHIMLLLNYVITDFVFGALFIMKVIRHPELVLEYSG